jgi:hypothetical protein
MWIINKYVKKQTLKGRLDYVNQEAQYTNLNPGQLTDLLPKE